MRQDSAPPPTRTQNSSKPPVNTSASRIDLGPPNPTIYIQNINERVKINDLKEHLSKMFSPFGHVQEVVAKKRLALRGQAFIVMESVEEAEKAIRALQGQRIYGKSMVCRFARFKSDYHAKADGSLELEKRRRQQAQIEKSKRPRLTRRQILAQMAANPQPLTQASPQMMGGGLLLIPNKILYLQQLPADVKEEELEAIFGKYAGMVEVRLVASNSVAFVEFETEAQSAIARQSLDGHSIREGSTLKVSFARR